MKNYTLIEHTADVGIRLEAKDLKELFTLAALAMFDIIAEPKDKIPRQKKIKIEQKADSLEELFINWLNELLSLSATKELIFNAFNIDELNEKYLEATALGASVNNYKINTEIKAATYHGLKITRTQSGWQAELIFDV